jgi:hypothetical protein
MESSNIFTFKSDSKGEGTGHLFKKRRMSLLLYKSISLGQYYTRWRSLFSILGPEEAGDYNTTITIKI